MSIIADYRFIVVSVDNRRVCPLGGCLGRSLFEIILTIAIDRRGSVFDLEGNMRDPERTSIKNVLDGDFYAGVLIGDYDEKGVFQGNIGSNCEGILSSVRTASDLITGAIDRSKPNGLTLHGYRDSRPGGHTLWGLSSVPPPPRGRPAPPDRERRKF